MSNSQGPIPNILTPAAGAAHLATEARKIQAGVELAKIRRFAHDLLRPFSSSSALDADLIIAKVCNLSRLDLITQTNRTMTQGEREELMELLLRRAKAEPIAYILGEKEFFGLTLKVNRHVLIPRPDTELLVEETLRLCQRRLSPYPKIIDVCTGSGCIAVALAHHIKDASIIATDLSAAALEVARENAATHRVEQRVEFRQGDLLEPCSHETGIDLIVSNPPYIKPSEMADLMPDVRDFEPHLALMGEDSDGLGLIRKIMAQAWPILKDDGMVMIEIGHTQAKILETVRFDGFSTANFLKDYAGIWRVVTYNRLPCAHENRQGAFNG